MRARFVTIPCLTMAIGCGETGSWMPLEVGRTSTYTVRSSFQVFVDKITVKRNVSVGPREGVELEGNLGRCRFAWNGPILITSQMANAKFAPPLPILSIDHIRRKDKDSTAENVTWQGKMTAFGNTRDASAVISQQEVKLDLGGKSVSSLQSDVLIRAGKTTIELRTWFQKGVGIIQQEQRTNRNLVVALQYVGR